VSPFVIYLKLIVLLSLLFYIKAQVITVTTIVAHDMFCCLSNVESLVM